MADNGFSESLSVANKSSKSISFGIDVIKLLSGTIVAQGLGVLSAPLLARLYGPSAFGILSIFTSILAVITAISCLRYEFAIMLPETNEEAANLMAGSILISVIISFITVFIFWLGNTKVTQLLNAPELGPYLWLIAPAIFFGGIAIGHPALNYWTTRMKHFGWLAVAKVFGSIVTIGFQIIAGFIGFATGGNLILAYIFGGGIVSTLVLGWQIWLHDGRFLLKSYNWKRMSQGLIRYKKFPLFDTWGVLLNTISTQLPTFFLAAYFSPSVAGFYAIGNNLLRLPMSVVGSAIAQVFYPRAAEAKVDGTLARMVEVTFYYLVKLGMFPLLVLTIVGKDLFIVVLGSRWSEAGVYTQILSVWTFFWLISTPLSNLFRLLEKQEFNLTINIIIVITRIISLLIGGLLKNARIALLIYSISGIIVYGYLSLAIMKSSGVPLYKMFRILFNNILLFLPAGILLFIMGIVGLSSWLLVGLSVIIIVIYYLFTIIKDNRILDFIIRIFRKKSSRLEDI